MLRLFSLYLLGIVYVVDSTHPKTRFALHSCEHRLRNHIKAAFTRDQRGSIPISSGTVHLNCVGFTRDRYHPTTVQFQTGLLS